MNNNNDNISYNEAVEELDAILQEIEDEAIDVDELTEKVKRASILIKICKQKLRNAESAIDQVFQEIDCHPDPEEAKEESKPKPDIKPGKGKQASGDLGKTIKGSQPDISLGLRFTNRDDDDELPF